jgi:tripartite-type tricarboxylate transporter receptor subunit TctC
LKEQGLDVVYPGWASLVAPAKTPAAIIRKLNADINRALASDALSNRYRDLVIQPVRWSPEEVAAFKRRDRVVLIQLVEEAGIKVE